MRKWSKFGVVPLILLLSALAPSLFGQRREIPLALHNPFRFVAYGDIRFTNPKRANVSKVGVRRELVEAIAEINPAFICIGGDLVYSEMTRRRWLDELAQELSVLRVAAH